VLLSIALYGGGSPAMDLVVRFVVPIIIATLTLSVLWVLLFLRNRAARRDTTASSPRGKT
jgi:hypothetical protein